MFFSLKQKDCWSCQREFDQFGFEICLVYMFMRYIVILKIDVLFEYINKDNVYINVLLIQINLYFFKV